MRTLENARNAWSHVAEVRHREDLKEALIAPDEPTGQGNRSLTWKICLLFRSYDHASWSPALANARNAYVALREHLLKAIENPDEVESAGDPLSDDAESPWNSLRQDEALRDEIFQDVDRTMPENLYFRMPSTQKMLVDILFVFCKLNPDVGYRQGMHEVLAPMLWVIERDAIDPESLGGARDDREADELLRDMFDSQYIEHDTFSIFGVVMQHAKAFYDPSARGPGENESPMLFRCGRIFEKLLPSLDPELANHLTSIDVLPQIFLMRWIRLLFSREFPFDDALSMWDLIFLEDPSLEIVDYISVAMLLRIRWKLIKSDSNTALTKLLHYPELPRAQGPQTLVTDAVHLRKDPTPDAARNLIFKYTKRTPSAAKRSSAQPSPSRQGRDTPRHPRPMSPSSRQVIQPGPSSLEIFLQGAANSVKSRGEKWGVNKTLRDAVDDVVKNVQGFQSGRSTPHSRTGSSMFGQAGGLRPPDAAKFVAALEDRNRSLAHMLENAISELWGHQESLVDATSTDSVADGLSTAIAKVHLVQVYLENSSLPLPLEESQTSQDTRDSQSVMSEKAPAEGSEKSERIETTEGSFVGAQKAIPERKLASPLRRGHRGSDTSLQTRLPQSGQKSSLMEPSPSETEPNSQDSATPEPTNQGEAAAAVKPPTNRSLTRPRQSLAQSSFSWMLEPGETRSSSANEGVRHEKRHAGKGFLFGESEEEDEGGDEKSLLGRSRAKRTEDAKKLDDVFYMGDLGSNDSKP